MEERKHGRGNGETKGIARHLRRRTLSLSIISPTLNHTLIYLAGRCTHILVASWSMCGFKRRTVRKERLSVQLCSFSVLPVDVSNGYLAACIKTFVCCAIVSPRFSSLPSCTSPCLLDGHFRVDRHVVHVSDSGTPELSLVWLM